MKKEKIGVKYSDPQTHGRIRMIPVCLLLFSVFGCKPVDVENSQNLTVDQPGIADIVTYPEELRQLHANLLAHYLATTIDAAQVQTLLDQIDEHGAWPSIDYTDKTRGDWPVKEHLEHLQRIAVAYQQSESPFYHDEQVSKKIHLSLNYWLSNDFLSTNWWDQHIGVPELLAPTIFLMEGELSQLQLDQALVLMRRAKIKMTGQNKVWLSGNVLMTSLLTRDVESVDIASRSIQDELKIANGVGIKADWSYHEHGNQLQFGNYGLSYLEDTIKWLTIVDQTPFQFSESKIEMLRNFILEGHQWVVWREKMDISACGRQLFPDEQANKFERLASCIQQMKALDEGHAEAYKNAMDSNVLTGNKHFWRSNFHVHRSPDFYFSVKMSSDRVIGTECVNEENVQGYYMGDGVSLLYTTGTEYTNVLPYWNWKQVPGITVVQDKDPLPIIKAWDFKTKSTFVGGVSNERNGIAVMGYNRDGVQAHKSWFMFGDKIVCLGSGIHSDAPFPVTTAIDQVFLKNDLVICSNGEIGGRSSSKQSLQPDWIVHDRAGYLFSEGSEVHMETRFLQGSWNQVAKRFRPIIITDSILRMWFDHGIHPDDAKYDYVLVPNATDSQMKALHDEPPFIISNEKEQQSVVSKDGDLIGIVFYEAGKSDLFDGIQVDSPCIVLVEKSTNGAQLSLCDPTQTLETIEISLNGNYQGENASTVGDRTIFKLPLPLDRNAGRTVSFVLQEEERIFKEK